MVERLGARQWETPPAQSQVGGAAYRDVQHDLRPLARLALDVQLPPQQHKITHLN